MPDSLSIGSVMAVDVLTAPPETTAIEAAELMESRDAGSLVVMQDGRPVGIFTERDLLKLIVKKQHEVESACISDVMTRELVYVDVDSTVEEAYSKMMNGNFRHLLVMHGNNLYGIVSIKDLVKIRDRILEQRVKEKTHEIRQVQKQLSDSLQLIRSEMATASRFQKNLIVQNQPEIPEISFSHIYEQADSLGGDYYEVVQLSDNRLGVFMADVMGHGVTSAMIAIEVKMNFDQVSHRHSTPGPVITRMNQQLIPLMPVGFFVAGFYGIINLHTLEMEYTQFGLPKPVLLKGNTGEIEIMPHGHVPIGIREESKYTSKTTMIDRGDSLLLFTDGCVEQKNPEGEMFGEERFINEFKAMMADGSNMIPNRLYNRLLSFAGDLPIGDDIAILLCEFRS